MEIIKIQRDNSKKVQEKAVEFIKRGRVVICPTDTVYGLLCDATNKKSVERIFKIKKREKSKPLGIFVKDIKSAKKCAFINKNQEKVLKEKWPGAVTVILKAKKGLSKLVYKNDTIGLNTSPSLDF